MKSVELTGRSLRQLQVASGTRPDRSGVKSTDSPRTAVASSERSRVYYGPVIKGHKSDESVTIAESSVLTTTTSLVSWRGNMKVDDSCS